MTLHEKWQLIPIGKDNAISREQLTSLLNCSEDRIAREYVEKMINKDMPVCNLRKGYFRPIDQEELQAYINIITSYKNKFLKKHYHLKKALNGLKSKSSRKTATG